MPQRILQLNQTTVWQSILSHKNISVKTLPWVALPNWLASPQVQALGCCLWVVSDSTTAHALHQQLCHATTSVVDSNTIALLGGDFPPAQERRWKQQHRANRLTALVVTQQVATRYLKIGQISDWYCAVDTVIWMDCLPPAVLRHHWQHTQPMAEGTTTQPAFWLLNPPDAALLRGATPILEEATSTLPVEATAQLHRFQYGWQATEALINQLKSSAGCTSITVIVCPTTASLRRMQVALATQPCQLLSLPAGTPWVLFNTLLETHYQCIASQQTDTLEQPTIVLLEEALLPAWRLFHRQYEALLPVQLLWSSLPVDPVQIGLVCEGFPKQQPSQIGIHIVREQVTLWQLPVVWRWILVNKLYQLPIHWCIQPVIPPWYQWGIRLFLNCLLYL